ncbi:MAG: aminoglycoside phosphotransferase family protein [Alphaproteobacteria bacterium]
MSPSANARAPNDPSLPQMAITLNERSMAAIFEAELSRTASAETKVETCDIRRVKYKPGKACRILYGLRVRPPGHGPRELLYSTRVFHPGQSPAQYAKAMARPLEAPPFGPPVLHLEAQSTVAWAVPNDRKLDGLAALLDAERLATEALPRIVTRGDASWRIVEATPRIMHLAPEYTGCARVDVRLENGCGRRRVATVFGKTYRDGAAERVHATSQRLWHSDSRQSGRLHIAEPLAIEKRHQLLWQEGLSGRPMLSDDSGVGVPATLIEPAALAVAALHGADIDCPPGPTVGETLRQLEKLRELTAQLRPSCAARVGAVVDELTLRAGDVDDEPLACLHGDLHPKNLLVDGARVSIIDLDDLARGAPLFDVGGFCAVLLHRSLSAGVALGDAMRAIARFLACYRRHVLWRVSNDQIVWHTAAALLVDRIYSCFTRLKPGQVRLVDELADLAQAVLLRDAMALEESWPRR